MTTYSDFLNEAAERRKRYAKWLAEPQTLAAGMQSRSHNVIDVRSHSYRASTRVDFVQDVFDDALAELGIAGDDLGGHLREAQGRAS